MNTKQKLIWGDLSGDKWDKESIRKLMSAAVACAQRLRTEEGRQRKLEIYNSPRTSHCRAQSRCAYLAVWLCFCKWLCEGDLEGPLRLCQLSAILHSDLVAWEALLDMSSIQEGVLHMT